MRRSLPWNWSVSDAARGLALLLMVLLLATPSARAEEEPPELSPFEAAKQRMEKLLEAARALDEAGATEEALRIYRRAAAHYEEALKKHLEKRAQAQPAQPLLPKKAVDASDVSTAVRKALDWLAAHQSAAGSWEASTFSRWCHREPQAHDVDGAGKASYTVGVTGLALDAFLRAGYGPTGKHPYAESIKLGLRYLRQIQDPEGCIGARATPNFIYNHGYAARALIRAYGMTGQAIYGTAAQKSLDFISMARNPYFGWRYGVKPGDNDTSVTATMISVLATADQANGELREMGKTTELVYDQQAWTGARDWVAKMTDDNGRIGYISRGTGPARPREMIDRFPGERSEAMTGAGLYIRGASGQELDEDKRALLGFRLMYKLPPTWNMQSGDIDMIYWYWGTLAMKHCPSQGYRNAWRKALWQALVPHQERGEKACSAAGSWAPVGPWGVDGGRVYSTALMCITLQESLDNQRKN